MFRYNVYRWLHCSDKFYVRDFMRSVSLLSDDISTFKARNVNDLCPSLSRFRARFTFNYADTVLDQVANFVLNYAERFNHDFVIIFFPDEFSKLRR